VEYPKHVADSYVRLSETVSRIKRALDGLPVNVSMHLVATQSLVGVIKSFSHKLRTQFAVIVNGKKVWDGYPLRPTFDDLLRTRVSQYVQP